MSSLDKLNAAMAKIPENSQYSLDEIQEAATEDDASFLSGMSVEANSALLKNVTEVTIDDEEEDEVEDTVETQEVEEPEEQEPQQNQLFNNNKKPKRPYTKKDKDNVGEWDSVLAQLSKDIIRDLINNRYTVGNFDVTTTRKILNYMLKKF